MLTTLIVVALLVALIAAWGAFSGADGRPSYADRYGHLDRHGPGFPPGT